MNTNFEWNIPNVLTILRIFLVPVIIIFIILNTATSLVIAFLLFLISAVSDILDGHIARKYSLQSDFGAYWDPLADKVLTLGLFTLFMFYPDLHIYWWLVLLLYIRDIGVTLIRNYFKKKNLIFKTTPLAKAKTVIQMVILGLLLVFIMYMRIRSENSGHPEWSLSTTRLQLFPQFSFLDYVPLSLTVLTVIFTIVSSLGYIKDLLKQKTGSRND